MPEPSHSVALRFFEGALWTTARNLLQGLLSLVALAIVARELGPSTYGIFGVGMLVYGIAEMVCGGAFTESIVQRKQIDTGHLDATFWLTTGLACTCAGAIAALSTPLAAMAGDANAADVVLALAAVLPLSVASRVPMALLARELKFKSVAQIGAASGILSCLLGITLALHGGGIWTLVAMEALRVLVVLTGSLGAVTWCPRWRGRWQHVRELWRFNVGVLFTYSIGYADLHLPRLLVSHLLGAHALGVFMLATRVYSELSRLLTEPLHGVAMATCARLQDAADELQRNVTGLYSASRLVVLPVFLGMAAVAPWWIPMLFGQQWLAATPAVQLLMLGGIRLATGAFNSAILIGTGRLRLLTVLFAAGCAASLVAFPLLAPWGVTGAAVAMLLRQFGTWPPALVWIGRATGLTMVQQVSGTLAPLTSALMSAGTIWGIAGLLEAILGPLGATIVAIIVGALIYALTLRVLAPQTFSTVVALLRALLRRDRAQVEMLLTRPA